MNPTKNRSKLTPMAIHLWCALFQIQCKDVISVVCFKRIMEHIGRKSSTGFTVFSKEDKKSKKTSADIQLIPVSISLCNVIYTPDQHC